MKCVLCKERSARRDCPAVRGYICPICCGEQREVTLDCPFECPYLQEGYRFELGKHEPPAEVPYKEHELPDGFLREHEPFIAATALALLEFALGNPGTVDADARAALDALIRTAETLSTGIVYETLPEGPRRVALYRHLQGAMEEWRKQQQQRAGVSTMREADVLRTLVFLGRLALAHDNRRPRGRSFLNFLRRTFPETAARESERLIIPGR